VGFCDFLQSLFAVTCHSSWSSLQAILPIFALSLYVTDGNVDEGGGNDDADGDGGNGDEGKDQVAQALLCLVLSRYSIQVCWLWRVFYLNILYHDIPLIEEDSHRLHNLPRQNIRFDSWTSQECFF
jgi:hypothetical protein